jgi:hypothetical protein
MGCIIVLVEGRMKILASLFGCLREQDLKLIFKIELAHSHFIILMPC